MKMFRPFIMMFLFLLWTTVSFAQDNKVDVNTDVDLVKLYEQVVLEGYATVEVYKELAMAQYFRSNYTEAKRWFEKWFELEMPKDATVKHRYKQTLKALKVSHANNKYLAVTKVVAN